MGMLICIDMCVCLRVRNHRQTNVFVRMLFICSIKTDKHRGIRTMHSDEKTDGTLYESRQPTKDIERDVEIDQSEKYGH